MLIASVESIKYCDRRDPLGNRENDRLIGSSSMPSAISTVSELQNPRFSRRLISLDELVMSHSLLGNFLENGLRIFRLIIEHFRDELLLRSRECHAFFQFVQSGPSHETKPGEPQTANSGYLLRCHTIFSSLIVDTANKILDLHVVHSVGTEK
jgi:hypothetical protein